VAKRIEALIAPNLASLEPGRHCDGDGLYFNVGEDGRGRSWLFRYSRNGQSHWMGLGPFPDISLAAARKQAKRCRLQLLDGNDPLEARQTERVLKSIESQKRKVFRVCAEDYIKLKAEDAKRPTEFKTKTLNVLSIYAFRFWETSPFN
jgi:hypothetical protein